MSEMIFPSEKLICNCKDRNYCYCYDDSCYNPLTNEDELYLEENYYSDYMNNLYIEKILNIGNREYIKYMKNGLLHNFYIISSNYDPCYIYTYKDHYEQIYESEWYHYGKLHNFYGYAVERTVEYTIQDEESNEFDGRSIGYYLYGKYYKKKEYLKQIELYKKNINEKLLYKMKSLNKETISMISDYLF